VLAALPSQASTSVMPLMNKTPLKGNIRVQDRNTEYEDVTLRVRAALAGRQPLASRPHRTMEIVELDDESLNNSQRPLIPGNDRDVSQKVILNSFKQPYRY
jgi:hypothetical protein